MTKWDLRMAASTLALGALLFAVACAITGATDEGAVPWTTRALRTLPAVPACGAAVTLLLMRRAERRGELLALASVGCSPARAALFAVAGAGALSLVAAAAIVTRGDAATGAFFPRATPESSVHVDGDAFLDSARGLRIASDGRMVSDLRTGIAKAPSVAGAPSERGRAAAAAFVLASFGVALALAFARPVPPKIVAAVGLACVTCIVLLQAAAAGRLSPAFASVPPLLLLIGAALRYRSPAW